MPLVAPRYIVYRNTSGFDSSILGLTVWDTQTNTVAQILPLAGGFCEEGCTNLDATFSFFRGTTGIIRLNLSTFAVTTISTNPVYLSTGSSSHSDICCNPDGTVLYMVGTDNRLAAMDSTTGTVLLKNLTQTLGFSSRNIVSFDGTKVFTSSESSSVATRCFNTSDLSLSWASSASGRIFSGTQSGKLLSVNASLGSKFEVVNASTGVLETSTTFPFAGGLLGAVMTNDSARLVCYITIDSSNRAMNVYAYPSYALLSSTPIPGAVGGANVIQNGRIFLDLNNEFVYFGGQRQPVGPLVNYTGAIQKYNINTGVYNGYPLTDRVSTFTSTVGFASVFAPNPEAEIAPPATPAEPNSPPTSPAASCCCSDWRASAAPLAGDWARIGAPPACE